MIEQEVSRKGAKALRRERQRASVKNPNSFLYVFLLLCAFA
jgi:hypothetical protein